MMAIPVTSVKPSVYENEPFNNMKNYEILMVGESACDGDTTIVCDSHYLDLQGEEFPFFFGLLSLLLAL
jgi:hypothetical protein